jgi:hypothetical protein
VESKGLVVSKEADDPVDAELVTKAELFSVSTNFFNTTGTPTFATFAPTMKDSAAMTRHLYSHKYGNNRLRVFQSLAGSMVWGTVGKPTEGVLFA